LGKEWVLFDVLDNGVILPVGWHAFCPSVHTIVPELLGLVFWSVKDWLPAFQFIPLALPVH